MQDPEELQGLAHFTEHMLFYASKKYPKEDEYSKFVSDRGGHTNAWTSAENTNFQFTVNWDALENTLDRFAQVRSLSPKVLRPCRGDRPNCICPLVQCTAQRLVPHAISYQQCTAIIHCGLTPPCLDTIRISHGSPAVQFFISPLISPDGIARERQAVDSEHSKNLQSDVWRRQQLWHTAADPAHPYSRFFTGNMDTLCTTPESKGIDVHAELLKFYAAQYSSNRMKLCVLGRHTVQELEAMVLRMFCDVPNKGPPPAAHTLRPTPPHQAHTSGALPCHPCPCKAFVATGNGLPAAAFFTHEFLLLWWHACCFLGCPCARCPCARASLGVRMKVLPPPAADVGQPYRSLMLVTAALKAVTSRTEHPPSRPSLPALSHTTSRLTQTHISSSGA